eukprot:gene7756-9594_t
MVLRIPIGGGNFLPLVSPPNTLADVTLTLPTICPYGSLPAGARGDGDVYASWGDGQEGGVGDGSFLPPTHAGHRRVGNTACALECPGPQYTEQEDAVMVSRRAATVYMSIVLISVQLFNVSLLSYKKQNFFLVASIVLALLIQIIYFAQLAVAGVVSGDKEGGEDLFCASPTVAHTTWDYNTSISGGVCVVTGLLTTYQSFLAMWVYVALAIEIWLRVVRGVKKVDFYRYFYMWGTLPIFIGHCLM